MDKLVIKPLGFKKPKVKDSDVLTDAKHDPSLPNEPVPSQVAGKARVKTEKIVVDFTKDPEFKEPPVELPDKMFDPMELQSGEAPMFSSVPDTVLTLEKGHTRYPHNDTLPFRDINKQYALSGHEYDLLHDMKLRELTPKNNMEIPFVAATQEFPLSESFTLQQRI